MHLYFYLQNQFTKELAKIQDAILLIYLIKVYMQNTLKCSSCTVVTSEFALKMIASIALENVNGNWMLQLRNYKYRIMVKISFILKYSHGFLVRQETSQGDFVFLQDLESDFCT